MVGLDIAAKLEDVRARVATAIELAGRTDDVTIVGVSKKQPRDRLEAAYEAGLRDFGENRAQELAEHRAWLPHDVRWHMIGPLQRNKVRVVRPIVHQLHSMDRRSLGEAWIKGSGLPPPVFVQVNVGEEAQKSGVAPGYVSEFIGDLGGLGIRTIGLMAIPPQGTPEEARGWFQAMAGLRDEIVSDHPSATGLSMGMSDDFELAIGLGSTCIRVGRTIFGARE
jgi:pyridoxal phosphate enzyme (YggS family)